MILFRTYQLFSQEKNGRLPDLDATRHPCQYVPAYGQPPYSSASISGTNRSAQRRYSMAEGCRLSLQIRLRL
jgi:hypothetical protein